MPSRRSQPTRGFRQELTPAVADSLEAPEARILAFEAEYRRPRPVPWKFTRQDFDHRMQELNLCPRQAAA